MANGGAGDLRALMLSTLALYGRAFGESAKGFRLNWWACFLPLFYFAIMGILSPLIAGLLGGLVGGLVLGLILAAVIANYLALISACVRKERVLRREIWERTVEVFIPVINVLFALFLLNLLTSMLLKRPDQRWAAMAINGVMVLLFNPLPEVTYQRPGGDSVGVFAEALEFMKENWLEWLCALALILLPVLAVKPEFLLTMFGGADPLNGVFVWLQGFQLISLGSGGVLSVVSGVAAFAASFYAMVFRGVLYHELSRSSRRKRIYQFKME